MDFTMVIPVLIAFVLSVAAGTGGNSCFKKTQDGSDRERRRVKSHLKKGRNADDGRRDDLVCDCGHFADLCKRVSEDDSGTFCNDWIRTGSGFPG